MRDTAQVVAALGREVTAEQRAALDALAGLYASVSAERFGRALAERWGDGPLDLDGVLLATACLDGDAAALRTLDAELLPRIADTLRRRAEPDRAEEALQLTRARLLVGPEPKLKLYAGRGPLLGFLRAVAANVLSNLEPARETESDEALAAVPDTADLESRLLKADQQLRFREAFAAAVKALTPRQRALLRLNLLDGLSIDEIAPMYGAHRSSAARWLAEAREALAAHTRAQLGTLLGLPPDEAERLLTSMQASFDLSLSRALRSQA